MSNFIKKARTIFRGYEIVEPEKMLSPACRDLLDKYFLANIEGEVSAIGVYPDLRSVVIIFHAEILSSHDEYSKANDTRIVKVTFLDVPDASVSYMNKPLPRHELNRLPVNSVEPCLHNIDSFELKGSGLFSSSPGLYHLHYLQLEARGLIVLFPYKDLIFQDVDEVTMC